MVVRGRPGKTYFEALCEARASVILNVLGLWDIEVREGRDYLVISVRGEGSCATAGSLAWEIRGAAGDRITVSCTRRLAEVEMAGFEPSASAEEVRGAHAKWCGAPTDISSGGAWGGRGGQGPLLGTRSVSV